MSHPLRTDATGRIPHTPTTEETIGPATRAPSAKEGLALPPRSRAQGLIHEIARLHHLLVLSLLYALERHLFQRGLLILCAVLGCLMPSVGEGIARVARERLHAVRILVDGVRQVTIAKLRERARPVLVIGLRSIVDQGEFLGAALDIGLRKAAHSTPVNLHLLGNTIDFGHAWVGPHSCPLVALHPEIAGEKFSPLPCTLVAVAGGSSYDPRHLALASLTPQPYALRLVVSLLQLQDAIFMGAKHGKLRRSKLLDLDVFGLARSLFK